MADDLDTGDSTPDLAYRWTIRTLYAVAIALNVWVLWDQLSDDADAALLKVKANQAVAKLLAPFHLDRRVRRESGAVIFEAMEIVEEAADQ
jgi:hypothetical protein